MIWFGNPEKLKLNEYENVLKRLIEVEQRVNSLEIENKVLRDKVLRKIQKLPNAEEEEKDSQKPFNPLVWHS